MMERSLFEGQMCRQVAVPGACNLRDLGGLPTVHGGRTRFGLLYRGEYPVFLAESASTGCLPVSWRSVVDLRRSGEVRFEQLPWESAGVRWAHRPLRLASGTSWESSYERYLGDGPDEFVAAISALTDPASFPALFHCAAGKDRTGVVAAVLLDLAQVERAAICADFALTAVNLRPIVDRLAATEVYRHAFAGTSFQDHVPVTATMERFLGWLEAEWGGAEGWLLSHGMRASDIEAYRLVFIDQA